MRLPQIVLPLLVAAVLAACTGSGIRFDGIVGEGALTTETRDVASFDAVEAGGGVHVNVAIGSTQSVTLEAQPNILAILETEVSGGTLHIRASKSYNATRQVTATIVVPQLTAMELSGGAVGTLEGLMGEELTLELSGGAQLSGSGHVGALDLTASGGAQADLEDMHLTTVQLEVSGGARANLTADESVRGSASGGSTVRVQGDATVDVSTSGGSSVE